MKTNEQREFSMAYSIENLNSLRPSWGWLLSLGILFIILGGIFLIAGKIPGIGKLPGDIIIKKENFSFYFPLTTCILISMIVSFLFALFHRK